MSGSGCACRVLRRNLKMATSPTYARPHAINYQTRAKWATVRIETDEGVYVGRIYVPETKKRLSDVLSDDRPFLSLTEVSVNDSERVEQFIALNKRYVRTVRVLNEGEADVVSLRR
jgi:hypothetical protein